jgi:Phytanoyl-CoA dioxygenase (PhyH)
MMLSSYPARRLRSRPERNRNASLQFPAVKRLTDDQRETFAREGFVVIPDVVDRAHIDAALHLINYWLDDRYDSAKRWTYFAQSYAPEFQKDPAIMGLFGESGVAELAAELVGRPILAPEQGQIALRYPIAPGGAPLVLGPHVDGVATKLNRVPDDGKIHGFTLLAGVMLSDVPAAGNGNFTLWPGSHLSLARWFAEHGTSIPDPDAFFRATEDVCDATAEPVALTGNAGDLVLSHHLVGHAHGPHVGPNVRYMVFFRLSSDARDELGDAVYSDPWAEWDAMRAYA